MTVYLIVSLIVSSFLALLIGFKLGSESGFKRGLLLGQDTFSHMMMDPRLRELCIKMADRKIPIENLQDEIIKAMRGET